jgi:hypothetical protein
LSTFPSISTVFHSLREQHCRERQKGKANMTSLVSRFDPELTWKSWSAIILFACGFAGLAAGVEVSERPGMAEANLMTKAYYALGLFVLGGLDLGTPMNGPLYARMMLWVA